MQVIYGDASNINLTAQKRLLRTVYGQTQATPYAGYIDPTLRNSEGNIEIPAATATKPFKRSEAAYSFPTGGTGGLVPGTCMVKTSGENFAVAAGVEKEKPFGLLGQWVGGTFDNLKGTNEISVWEGPDSVFDVLVPAINTTGISTAITEYNEAVTSVGKNPVYLYAGADGRLTYKSGYGINQGAGAAESLGSGNAKGFYAVAEVIEEINKSVFRIKLLV